MQDLTALGDYVTALFAVTITLAIAWLTHTIFELSTAIRLYLVPIILAASRSGHSPATVAVRTRSCGTLGSTSTSRDHLYAVGGLSSKAALHSQSPSVPHFRLPKEFESLAQNPLKILDGARRPLSRWGGLRAREDTAVRAGGGAGHVAEDDAHHR